MFIDNDLKNALETNLSLQISSHITAEFNLNDLENIEKIGVYRYRPFSASSSYYNIATSYDESDVNDDYTDSEISYEEYKNTNDASPFVIPDNNPNFFYSLGDCFLPFRPRSGINKSRFLSNNFIDNIRSSQRPRYYMASKDDYFKYWSSYKKEGTVERGLSFPTYSLNTGYGIDDACPFVVYSSPVNANRVVIKMQTNVGDIDLGPVRTSDDIYIDDPLYDYEYSSTPKHWKIQILNSTNQWVDIAEYNHISTRSDASPIIPKNGNVELFYGIKIPNAYIDSFNFKEYTSYSLLPSSGNILGDAYIYGSSTASAGTLVIWNGTAWEENALEYGWSLLEEDNHIKTNGVCKEIVNPLYYTSSGQTIFREFQKIYGIRLVVKTMNAPQTTFDLIEISPRLIVNITDYVSSFDINKTIASSENGLPVGALSVSNGDIKLSNMQDAFTIGNTLVGTQGSIISEYLSKNIKFNFYEVIHNINQSNKYIPMKTLYSDTFVSPVSGMTDISIPLRDLFFRLETTNAPSLLSTETTLTYAVANILDYIGFNNYIFKKINDYNDPTLPFFFVEKDASVAEVLQRIAIATQSAMFFDEYNNFVVMTKEYLLPTEEERATDFSLSGNQNPMANIDSLSMKDSIVINNGNITYTTRYIQKEISSLDSAIRINNERVYRYKPVLLWEVAANEETKTINDGTKGSAGFSLGAVALNTYLSASVPYVENNQIVNNVINVGENIYWLPRFQGYLYANGEIIRFDAVEHTVSGLASPNVWISNNKEYQEYFANLPFNGKIYPTGRIRIYSEPYYETVGETIQIKNGPVKYHGRGQFSTEIVEHQAGLSEYWSSQSNIYGIDMYSENIFTTTATENLSVPSISSITRTETTGNDVAKRSTRNGIIKNFMASKVFEDGYINNLKTTDAGTIQSSALVFKGPKASTEIPQPRDLISYLYKDLSGNSSFRHFGTRIRIIGKADSNFGQLPNGSSDYYAVQSQSTDQKVSINGGSGGLGIFVDPINGSGYYLELVALNETNMNQYSSTSTSSGEESVLHNIIFYKINSKTKKNSDATENPEESKAVPQKLWGGTAKIISDPGTFVGQDRLGLTENISVYDISMEYQVLNSGAINFFIYINGLLVKVVKDINPLPIKTSVALFVRSSSECMFENLYALENLNYKNESETLLSVNSAFDKTSITTNDFMRRYAISGVVQSTYLSSISSTNPLNMKIFYEEFGTIFRECAHFRIDYDQAYPAFYSKIARTFSSEKTYTVSGYYGGAYEAEFLVFNAADKAIVLDETTGSYLRILGITFTQNSTNSLTVDDYYNQLSDSSKQPFNNNYLISPDNARNDFNKIKASRSKYGDRQFSLDSIYLQSKDQAEDIMQWMINKTMKPRKRFSVSLFAIPTLQVGDIVTIDYKTPNDVTLISSSSRFLIESISYSRSTDDVSQTIEVVEI